MTSPQAAHGCFELNPGIVDERICSRCGESLGYRRRRSARANGVLQTRDERMNLRCAVADWQLARGLEHIIESRWSHLLNHHSPRGQRPASPRLSAESRTSRSCNSAR